MKILTIRTDKPESEIGLYDGKNQLAYVTWPAHRELAETIHLRIKDILAGQKIGLKDVEAITVYKGPGSFTGLRIGISVANALAYGLNIPIVGTTNDDWIEQGLDRLANGASDEIIVPEYGSPPHITAPKK